MPTILSDAEIEVLIQEPKPLPLNFESRLALRQKRGHREAELDVAGESGSEFRIILRKSSRNPLDFSLILAYLVPQSNQVIRLRRYNGKSHEHTNALEGDRFYGFHIHYATERYQRSGNREDAFAQLSDRYATFDEALECLLGDCGFVLPSGFQSDFFGI